MEVDKMDVVELNLSLAGYIKPPVKLEDLSLEEKINAYKNVFGKDVFIKQFVIEVEFWNPSSHEMDWCLVSSDNNETLSEEMAKTFMTEHEAKMWTLSDEAKEWKSCRFKVIESSYSYDE